MAKHISDFKKATPQIIIDLINEQNSATSADLQLAQVTLGTPQQIEFSDLVQILVSSKTGSGYFGTQTFTYSRVALSDVPGMFVDPQEWKEYNIETLGDILTFINGTFGINLGPDDVTVNGNDLTQGDPTYEQEFDVGFPVLLEAKADNLVWTGNIQFTLMKVRDDLNDLVKVVLLDGLYPPFKSPVNPVFLDTEGFLRKRPDGSIRMMAVVPPQ